MDEILTKFMNHSSHNSLPCCYFGEYQPDQRENKGSQLIVEQRVEKQLARTTKVEGVVSGLSGPPDQGVTSPQADLHKPTCNIRLPSTLHSFIDLFCLHTSKKYIKPYMSCWTMTIRIH